MSGPRRDSRGEWRFQFRHQLLASDTPDGGFSSGGGGVAPAVTLGELVRCHDEEFVRNAYRRILLRDPDPTGLSNAVAMLRGGDLGKIDLLGSLRYSEEGCAAGVEIHGLRRAYLLNSWLRLPVVGYLLRSAEVLLNLPRIVQNMERFEAFTNARFTGVQAAQRALRGASDTERLSNRLDALERSVRDMANVLYLADDELGGGGIARQPAARPASVDSAIAALRDTILGRSPEAGSGRVADHTPGETTLVGDTQSVHQLAEAAKADSASLRIRVEQFAKALAATGDALVSVKRQLSDFQKQQERFERALPSIREDFKQARGTLQEELGQALVDLREQAAEETEARAALGLELRGLSAQVDADIARLRASVTEESEQLDRRLEAEIKVREALGEVVQSNEVERGASAESLKAEIQHLSVQTAEEVKARELLGSHFDDEFAKRRELENRFAELELVAHQLRKDLTYADWRIANFVSETRKRFPEVLERPQIQHIVEEHDQHRLDSLYAAFEDAFRGTREDIKTRQAVYLPYVKEAKAGSRKSPIVDIGCGRGEWLELLREQELEACGVDSNRVMVERCTALGLHVELSDVHTYLGKLKDSSIGCVTGFHIVEHLPFDALIGLFDEVLRVLRPGGMVIFETPNPRNILVSSTEFFNDPTHKRPLPPHVLKFLAESRGFCRIEVLELHPFPKVYTFEDDGKVMTRRLNDYFYGPQDYSIVGRKA